LIGEGTGLSAYIDKGGEAGTGLSAYIYKRREGGRGWVCLPILTREEREGTGLSAFIDKGGDGGDWSVCLY